MEQTRLLATIINISDGIKVNKGHQRKHLCKVHEVFCFVHLLQFQIIVLYDSNQVFYKFHYINVNME